MGCASCFLGQSEAEATVACRLHRGKPLCMPADRRAAAPCASRWQRKLGCCRHRARRRRARAKAPPEPPSTAVRTCMVHAGARQACAVAARQPKYTAHARSCMRACQYGFWSAARTAKQGGSAGVVDSPGLQHTLILPDLHSCSTPQCMHIGCWSRQAEVSKLCMRR